MLLMLVLCQCFYTVFREREYAMDLIEDYCGARLTHSAVRIGGVPLDLPEIG